MIRDHARSRDERELAEVEAGGGSNRQNFADGGTALLRMPASAFGDDGGVARQTVETILPWVDGYAVSVGALGIYWAQSGGIMRLGRAR
jgi:hypothetical protein